MALIEGRTVFVRTGPRTQTINICDGNNRLGDYDWKIRVFGRPNFVTDEQIEAQPTILDLVEWLKRERSGRVEQAPPVGPPPVDQPPEQIVYQPEQDPWVRQAVILVEHAIDQLVQEFLEFPYLHRVEHSIHCRLYHILCCQPHFSRTRPLAHQLAVTQVLHKEWPEPIPRPGHRRGNLDLAVLSPQLLVLCPSIDVFRQGRLAPPIAIEIGLDYDWAHLDGDQEKLTNSIGHVLPPPGLGLLRYGFLVHLVRGQREEEAEQIITNPEGNDWIKTAYGCANENQWIKLVNEAHIHPMA